MKDLKKWFEDQNIEPIQDRNDGMDYHENYELYTYNDLMECMEALLILHGVSKPFAEGVEVVIIKRLYGHKFAIGNKVTIVRKDGGCWIAEDKKGTRGFIEEDEANVC